MTYDAIIFDLFGTLVDNFSFHDYQCSLSAMAATLGVPSQDFHHLWSETARARGTGLFATLEANIEYICQGFGLHVGADRVVAATRIRLDLTRQTLTPRQDALEMLGSLKADGYRIGLTSDCSPEVPLL